MFLFHNFLKFVSINMQGILYFLENLNLLPFLLLLITKSYFNWKTIISRS